MITETLDAWVIHKYWSGDTSARVVFFTQHYGLVTCLYKGGRTPKKQALLRAFTPLSLVMDIHKETYFYVRQLELTTSALTLVGQTLFAGLYLNELLYHALRPQDPHEGLYLAYKETLHALTTASDRFAMEALLRRFEWALLTASGYPMSLTEEVGSGTFIAPNAFYQLRVGEGFIQAEEGISGAHILAFAEDRLDEPAVLSTAKRIMRAAIDHALDGKEIKARALYRM